MGNNVKERWMYAMADALNMSIEYRKDEPHLRGSKEVEIDLGGLDFTVKAKIVSSLLNRKNCMAIVKATGNLSLLVAVMDGKDNQPKVSVHILNLAKMGLVDNWLEKNRPSTPAEAWKMLDKAIVKSFAKVGNFKWQEIAA